MPAFPTDRTGACPGHLTLASSVEKNTNENEFQCQLKFRLFPLPFEKKFQLPFARLIIFNKYKLLQYVKYYHINLIKSYSKQRTAMHNVSRCLIIWAPAESNLSNSGKYFSDQQCSALVCSPTRRPPRENLIFVFSRPSTQRFQAVLGR